MTERSIFGVGDVVSETKETLQQAKVAIASLQEMTANANELLLKVTAIVDAVTKVGKA